jgi:hypothetical protein
LVHSAYYPGTLEAAVEYARKHSITIFVVAHVFTPELDAASISFNGVDYGDWTRTETTALGLTIKFTVVDQEPYEHREIFGELYNNASHQYDGFFAQVQTSFDHDHDKHVLIRMDYNGEPGSSLFYPNKMAKKKKMQPVPEAIIVNQRYQIMGTFAEMKENTVALYTPQLPDGRPGTPLLVRKIEQKMCCVEFKQKSGWDYSDWYYFIMKTNDFSVIVDVKIFNSVVRELLLRQECTTENIMLDLTKIASKSGVTGSIETALPILYEAYYVALGLVLNITSFSSSVLIDALNKAKKKGIFKPNDTTTIKSLANYLFGSELDYESSKHTLLNTRVSNWTFHNHKIQHTDPLDILKPLPVVKQGYSDYQHRSSCVSPAMFDLSTYDPKAKMHRNTLMSINLFKWKSEFLPANAKYSDVIGIPAFACNRDQHKIYKNILPAPNTRDWPISVYHVCPMTTLTALMRHSLPSQGYDYDIIGMYNKFVDEVYFPQVEKVLQKFKYHVNGWYNHLFTKQQDEVQKYIDGVVTDKVQTDLEFDIIPKTEIQLGGRDDCKVRAICAPKAWAKYVCGPVMHALEKLFRKEFDSWGTGYSYDDKCEWLNNNCTETDNLVVSLDISGLDRSVRNEHKRIGFKVYNWLVDNDKITHVKPGDFLEIATAPNKTIVATYSDNKDRVRIAKATVDGTVASGSADTSFLNTLIMDSVVQFMLHSYRIKAKAKVASDDVIIVLPIMPKNEIVDMLSAIFSHPNAEKPVGIGLVVKEFKITKPIDATPCSTELYLCDQCGYRMTRKLDRFCKMTPYSIKCLGYSKHQQAAHLNALSIANERWCKGLPIYRAYNKIMRTGVNVDVLKSSRRKQIRDVPEEFSELYTDEISNDIIEVLGKDASYAMKDRVCTVKKCCIAGYEKMLQYRYNLGPETIRAIELNIATATMDTGMDVTELVEAFSHNEYRVANHTWKTKAGVAFIDQRLVMRLENPRLTDEHLTNPENTPESRSEVIELIDYNASTKSIEQDCVDQGVVDKLDLLSANDSLFVLSASTPLQKPPKIPKKLRAEQIERIELDRLMDDMLTAVETKRNSINRAKPIVATMERQGQHIEFTVPISTECPSGYEEIPIPGNGWCGYNALKAICDYYGSVYTLQEWYQYITGKQPKKKWIEGNLPNSEWLATDQIIRFANESGITSDKFDMTLTTKNITAPIAVLHDYNHFRVFKIIQPNKCEDDIELDQEQFNCDVDTNEDRMYIWEIVNEYCQGGREEYVNQVTTALINKSTEFQSALPNEQCAMIEAVIADIKERE